MLSIFLTIVQLCEWKGINIVEEVCPDHIHMLLEIPQKYSVSGIIGYLKRKNTKAIKEYIANKLKEDKETNQMTLEDIDPFDRK